METSVKRTERYRVLKNNGLEWKEILKNFKTKTRMRVFSYKGEIDTTMTPWDSILYYKHFLRSGFIAIDPHNGYIKAYVGGIDFKHFKFDHVKQGKRQVGSTIKPFLYTLAMAEGFSPCYKVMNVPVTFFLGDTTWTPKNSGKNKYDGQMVTLRWGLANSVNNITAWVMKQFNPSVVINDVMRKMGITSKLDPVPSLVLGTPDISLYEMVSAYATYANKGVYTKPVFVTRIEDKNGNILFSSKQIQKEAINENTAYLMVNMMESVINAGTGARLRYLYNFDFPIAGKTGTTQNHSDGWFIGITPNLVAGAWVGGEDRSIHFDGIDKGQGASMALPIWANFFKKVHENKNIKLNWSPFERPANFNYDLYCADNTQEIKSIEELKEIEAEY